MQDKAVFVDLDDTLITTRSGRKYPIHSEDWKFIPETIDAIQYYSRKNYMIIIVSNQLGIEEGYVIEKAFITKLEKICKTIEKELKIKSQSIHYNYNNKANFYTMPNPGLLYELAIDYELNLKDCIVIGSNNITNAVAANVNASYLNVMDVTNIDWTNK